jgi:hypothetical protein
MPVNVGGNDINALGAKLYNSTKTVTNGLVWYYDFGIADSYPGSGTSITDFTGNGNTATLADQTYTTTYGGVIQNSSAGSGAFGSVIPLSNFSKLVGTCEFWARPTVWQDSTGLFVNRDTDTVNSGNWWWLGPYGAGSTLYFRLGNSAGCCGNDNSIGSWSSVHAINTWGLYTVTWNSGVNSSIYFNGTLRQTVSITAIPNANDTATGRLGLGHTNTNSRWLGQIAVFKHYNRVLSAAEILQNYQADRTRFGK